MSTPAVIPPFAAEAVAGIATDLFAAMVDGEPGHVELWHGEPPVIADLLFTWIDIQSDATKRVLLATERGTGERITRALLQLPEDAAVADADFADAVGEIANVVGGNVKSMVLDSGSLTLPQVSDQEPDMAGASVMIDVWLSWRSAPLRVSLWTLP